MSHLRSLALLLSNEECRSYINATLSGLRLACDSQMQSGGGNPMNAAQLARLQQQLAQYGRGNGQQQMMNPNAMGGMGNQQSQQQQLQQAFMQQQLQQNQGQQGAMLRRNSSLGMNSNSAALAMMQQQQQNVVAGGSQMANASMPSYWNALQNQNTGTMDATSSSSAQLAALAGMNMNNANSSQNSTANLLLGNRSSQSQPQVIGMGNNQQVQSGGMGQTTDANLLQQQIAQLQRQLQQQQQMQQQMQQQPASQVMGGMQGSTGMDRRNSASSFGGMQGNQQQLYQQMQMASGMMGQDTMGMGQNKMGNEQFGSMSSMMMSGSRGGMSEQELLLQHQQQQQQQQLLRSGGMAQSMQNDSFMGQNNQAELMGQRRSSAQQQMDGSNRQSNNMSAGFNNNMGFDMDGSVHSQLSAGRQSQNKENSSPLDTSSGHQMPGDKGDDQGATQKSFLDGSFAGGWQSNADLPDRRRVIFSILEVIRQMRPDTNKISQK